MLSGFVLVKQKFMTFILLKSPSQNNVEIEKTQKSADIETAKFKQIVDAIGSGTIQAMAQAGPDMQVRDAVISVDAKKVRSSFIKFIL